MRRIDVQKIAPFEGVCIQRRCLDKADGGDSHASHYPLLGTLSCTTGAIPQLAISKIVKKKMAVSSKKRIRRPKMTI